jgi:predicted acyltransferase
MSQPTSHRLRALDIFRGATIASMVIVNSLGTPADSFQELLHAAWNGWTFADVIFPCFLFIVGCSVTLSSIARRQRGADNATLVLHAMKRTLLLFAAGVAIDWIVFPQRSFPYVGVKDHLQLTGVLQKIAVCYLSAFLICLWIGWRGVLFAILALNLLYLGFLYLYKGYPLSSAALTIAL